ncbi:MAG: DUF4194 domain-containing protein [Chloroflexota bacterium]
MSEQPVEEYAPVLLKLLQSVVNDHDTATWELLMRYRSSIENYFSRMGLRLVLSENYGYAYLEQPREDEDGNPIKLPRLTRRSRLTAKQTLLAILLREKLDEHDQRFDSDSYLILSTDEIYTMMSPFLEEVSDERRSRDHVNRDVNRLIKIGLLSQIRKENKFRVERVIMSRITSDVLNELKEKLKQHVAGETP